MNQHVKGQREEDPTPFVSSKGLGDSRVHLRSLLVSHERGEGRRLLRVPVLAVLADERAVLLKASYTEVKSKNERGSKASKQNGPVKRRVKLSKG